MTSTVLTTATTGPWAAHWADHWAGGPGGPGGWWWIFPFLWFGFLFTLLATFAFFGRRRWRYLHAYAGVRAGEARLAERYAAGEIDEQEYQRRLFTLKRMGSGTPRSGPSDFVE